MKRVIYSDCERHHKIAHLSSHTRKRKEKKKKRQKYHLIINNHEDLKTQHDRGK